jgi:tetratricopeptide (TPR) repeat protein
VLGRAVEALPYGRRAVETAGTLEKRDLSANAYMVLGAIQWLLGQYREARHHLERSCALTQSDVRSGVTVPFLLMAERATARAWLACNLVELGEFESATRIAQEALRITESAPYRHLLSRFAVSWVQVQRGEWMASIPDLEEGLAHCRSLNPNMLTPYTAALGRAYSLAGRVDEAVVILADAVSSADTYNLANRALWLSFLSEAYLLAGRPTDAADAARRGIGGARIRQERGDEAWNLRALAEALCANSADESGAADHYGAALALAEELGMRPLVAHCHSGLARLCRRAGNLSQAKEHLVISTAMFREMGMRSWLEQADLALKTLE